MSHSKKKHLKIKYLTSQENTVSKLLMLWGILFVCFLIIIFNFYTSALLKYTDDPNAD